MQKTKAKLPVLFILLTVTAVCVLRFFQLVRDTDSVTGMIVSHSNISFVVYGLEFLIIILSAVYAVNRANLTIDLAKESSDRILRVTTVFFAISMFLDFVHQCYNCYEYIERVSFVEYAYLVPLILSGLFALISCFYFVSFAISINNSNYDFTNFTLIHLMPLFWAFTKLFKIMLDIVDVKISVEICLEFLVLIFVFCFIFAFLLTIDNKKNHISKFFVFSSVVLPAVAATLVLPRYIVMICGKGILLSKITYTGITYIMFGLFALVLLCDIIKRSSQKN